MRKILFIILLQGTLSIFAQTNPTWQNTTKEEVVAAYKKICDWFVSTTSYSFSLKYASYKDHFSSEIIESSTGFYKRSGKKYISNAVGIKTIQNDKNRIVVDSADKLIAITEPGTLSPTMQNPDELLKLLEKVKSLKKKNINLITTYKVQFLKNELYDAYEFSVNEKGLLTKLIYYYAEQTEREYGDGENEKPFDTKVKPRLEIDFLEYTSPLKIQDDEFNDRAILIAANNKVTTLDKYKNYQVKDYRQPKK